MGLEIDTEAGDRLHKRYKEVWADLNLDKASADEAWQSFQRIGRNYTLEGDKLHWLACALYVSCRKGVTPTIGGRGGIEGNCVSLTRLLRSCKLSLVQFFSKMKKWSDMANLPHEMRNRIDHHERNFNVSTVIFKKFKPIFLDIFKDPSLSPSKPIKNRKQSRKQSTTSNDVFSFCWTLFIHVKAHFPAISDDLVNSYHLLLACIDFCYNNAIVAENGKELLNPLFSELPNGFKSDGYRPPESVACIIQTLCVKWDGIHVDAKGIKEHWWKPYVKRMVERRLLKCARSHQLVGFFDTSLFEYNIRTINTEHDQHVLKCGDFDERIFLSDNAHEELGTPQTSPDELTQRILKQGLKKHMDETTTLAPATPLSNRHYLKDKDAALTATPVSSATHTVGQLHSLLLDRKPAPSEALSKVFGECVPNNPQEFIENLITEIGQIFVNAYCQPSTLEEQTEMPLLIQPDDFAKKRLELGVSLYYRCLENIMNREKKRLKNSDKIAESLSNLLFQETMHVSLFACSMEIILFSYNSQRSFPWIIDIFGGFRNLNFQPFHFYKVVELIIRDEDGLSRSVVKHLNSIEEQILGSMAWKSNSALWDAIKVHGSVPSSEEVALPNFSSNDQKTLLASPMAAVKKLSRDAFASPMANSTASERFGSPIAAKRKLFDAQSNSDQAGSIITISLPTQNANGELRYVQIPAFSVTMSQNSCSLQTKMDPPRPKAGPLGLFFRKVYNLSWIRIRDLYDRLNITEEDLRRKIWTCFELSLKSHAEILMRDRHIDQLLMCAIYAMCKVAKHDVSFQDIMKCYRMQPQSKSHIYRSVLLSARTRRNSATSETSRNSGSNSPVGSQEERERIRSSSTLPIPHPNSQPPTPTRLAGTGSQFDFGEERGDLIMFYNQVFVPEMKSYVMQFTPGNNSPILSPLPRLAQNPVSPYRRISQLHKVFVSPMKAPNFPSSPKRPLSYSFLRSPAKELRAINTMMKMSTERKPVSKRILQDDANESENSPAKRQMCSDLAPFKSKIQNIFTERQGTAGVSDDSSSNFVENGNDSSGD